MLKKQFALMFIVISLCCCSDGSSVGRSIISKQFDVCTTSGSEFSYNLKYGIDSAYGKVVGRGGYFMIYIGRHPKLSNRNFEPPENLSSSISKLWAAYDGGSDKYKIMYGYNNKSETFDMNNDFIFILLISNKGKIFTNIMNDFGRSLVRCFNH